MTKEKTWCVYVHISPSIKYYVGITSQKPEDRWRNGKGYKHNDYFTKAINKYGWDNFQHEVIASNLTEEEAKNFEKILIEKFKSNNREYGYNFTKGGDGTVGVSHFGTENSFYGKHHSDENKAIFSQKSKERWQNGIYDEILCRPIYQFDMNGDFICGYSSTRKAEDMTGIDHRVIVRVCNGSLNYTHGFTWAYQDECEDLNKFKQQFLLKLKKKRSSYAKHLRKPIDLYDLDGNFIANFESASELARQFNVHKDTVSWSCRHDGIFQGKFKCKYA